MAFLLQSSETNRFASDKWVIYGCNEHFFFVPQMTYLDVITSKWIPNLLRFKRNSKLLRKFFFLLLKMEKLSVMNFECWLFSFLDMWPIKMEIKALLWGHLTPRGFSGLFIQLLFFQDVFFSSLSSMQRWFYLSTLFTRTLGPSSVLVRCIRLNASISNFLFRCPTAIRNYVKCVVDSRKINVKMFGIYKRQWFKVDERILSPQRTNYRLVPG